MRRELELLAGERDAAREALAVAERENAELRARVEVLTQERDAALWTLAEAVDAEADVRTCRVCGCTDDDCQQCIERTGEPCHWVEADLCSACVGGGAGATTEAGA